LFKALLVILCGSGIGFLSGWFVHQSRYGVPAAFGPFSETSDLTAQTIAAHLKQKAPSKTPHIEIVGGEEFDFGVMEPDSKGAHTFIVRNTGEAPLSLEIVGSTCKCTIGKLAKSEIGPGEETGIDLTWDVKSAGESFGQSAILKTNDPARGELNLKIKGRVISQMAMQPRQFSFGEVATGETIKLESTIYNFTKQPIVPVAQRFSDESLNELTTFKVEEKSLSDVTDPVYASATQAFQVTAEIRPGAPQGAVQQNFIFEFVDKADGESKPSEGDAGDSSKEAKKMFAAPLTGRFVGAITLVESSRCVNDDGNYYYTIGRIDPSTAEPSKANIMLRGKYKDSLKLTVGDVEPAGVLHAELGEPVGRGSIMLYPLRLWVDPETKSGEWLGKSADDYGVVWIRTDNPEVSPLKLRVRFAVAKK
jgi:hypothetical protein